jgi:hypothetical protein
MAPVLLAGAGALPLIRVFMGVVELVCRDPAVIGVELDKHDKHPGYNARSMMECPHEG